MSTTGTTNNPTTITSGIQTSPSTKTPTPKKENMFNTLIKLISENISASMQYFIMIIFCIFIIIVFAFASFNKSKANQRNTPNDFKTYTYLMMIFIPTLLLVYLFLRKGQSDLDPKTVMIIGGCIVFVTITILLSYYKNPTSSKTSSILMNFYVVNIILLAILIVGLAIGYKILKHSARKMKGWPGFIVNFLFFIPCLLSDFIDYMFLEFKNAPNTVYVLFILEIILILAYIYIPKLLKYFIFKNGITLQSQPVYLNKSTIVSNSDIFLLPNSLTSTIVSDISSNIYNSNFGLSMWIYVNNMGTNKIQENGSIIFQNSSPNNANGKPGIRYMGNDQWNFIFSDQLIQYNTFSSNNVADYKNTNDDNELTNFYNSKSQRVSEIVMLLYDANKNNSDNTLYGKLKNIEKNYSEYTITYTYSYGSNNVNVHDDTDTYSSIDAIKNNIINNDYKNYKQTVDTNRSKIKNMTIYGKKKPSIRVDELKFTHLDMFHLVQNITQTIMYKDKNSLIMTIPSQKWNHIVFNYYENSVDLFINGNLERSVDLKNNPIIQLPTDTISLGDEDGIHGALCNLVYYNIPLTQTKISQIYNINSMKNPPL